MEPDDIDDDAVREALRTVRSGEGVELGHVVDLAVASVERSAPLVPQPIVDAVGAMELTERDVFNGGLDQFVWNHGVEVSRAVAAACREVGALENADTIDRLASELDQYQEEVGRASIEDDPVRHFHAYRRRGGGPVFGIPAIGDELADALVEYATTHADQAADPDAPLPTPVQ